MAQCSVSAGRSNTLEMQVFNSGDNELVVSNASDKTFELPEHTTLALFGTGRFKYVAGGMLAGTGGKR